MGTTTPLIRYSLKDRGRKFTGQPRSFNIQAIVDSINSPECQERVAARDMLGYFGHWPRVRFGMMPQEGGLDGGKSQAVEPAIVTTHLKAYPDGTVEHQTEFLDTDAGRIAEKMWAAKVGGFSSAIDVNKPRMFGFDYVNTPNYLANSHRGVVLDDAGDAVELTLDAVVELEAEEREQADAISILLDNVQAERTAIALVVERLQIENEQLISMLASTGRKAESVLDSESALPISVSERKARQMQRDAAMFRSTEALPQFVGPAVLDKSEPSPVGVESRLIRRFLG